MKDMHKDFDFIKQNIINRKDVDCNNYVWAQILFNPFWQGLNRGERKQADL